MANIYLLMGQVIKDIFEYQNHDSSFSKPLNKPLIKSLKLSFLG